MARKQAKDPVASVDPFLGNGATDLTAAEGIAAAWFWPKAQVGNTHPGACYPFGMVSACAYSGAYDTGYGRYEKSTDGQPRVRHDQYTATGFAHFQQSGTGDIQVFYNYVKVVPLTGSLAQLGARWVLEDEEASPGYYAATLADTGIHAELTVGRRVAMHRYTFPGGRDSVLAIDLSEGGIEIADREIVPTAADFRLEGDCAVIGSVTVSGIELFFCLEIDAPVSVSGIVNRGQAEPEERAYARPAVDRDNLPFGAFFVLGPAYQANVRIGFSLRSVAQARFNADELRGRTFDQVARATRDAWSAYLGRVQVAGASAEQRQIYYSALYHSLIKPCDFTGESPFWAGDDPLFLDLATMWDMYKTQLPLVLTVYPEVGRQIARSLLAYGRHYGRFPNETLISHDYEPFDSSQARALAHVTLADAWHRRMEGIDWREAAATMERVLLIERNREFLKEGVVHPLAHTLDLANACFCTAQVARGVGDEALYQRMMGWAGNWTNAYDPETARLGESWYYEGTGANYSFRLLHDMAGRIALNGSAAAFVADMDRFFGYGAPPCQQPVHRPYGDVMAVGFALGRFEGLNNEPDMETPYGYIYAGRPDRTAEIVRAVMRYQYTTGRGGLPGNDDSGALSSWYVWNAIGLFPVAGQDVFLIGSPIFERATIALSRGTLTIETKDNSPRNLYVRSAALNGQAIDRAYVRYAEIAGGGTLTLDMAPEPTAWGRTDLPPSYPGP
jgi:putative alpha-1,2-mannosidase